MTSLIVIEMRRLLARRLLRGLTILALLLFTLAGTIAYVASDDSAAAVAAAEAKRDDDVRSCVAEIRRSAFGAEEMPRAARRDPQTFCEEQVWVEDPRFDYSEMSWPLSSLAIPMMMLGWLIGASFIGAEWHTRNLTTLLTWEPRRVRILAAKLIALTTVVSVWVVLLQAVFSGAMYPAAAFQGTTAGLDVQWWAEYAELMLRGSGLAAIASVFGLSLATVGRNTAAAFGVGFFYFAVVESLVRNFRPQWVDWLIGDNVALFLMGADEVAQVGHSQLAAGLLLASYAAALFTGALLIFRRREVG